MAIEQNTANTLVNPDGGAERASPELMHVLSEMTDGALSRLHISTRLARLATFTYLRPPGMKAHLRGLVIHQVTGGQLGFDLAASTADISARRVIQIDRGTNIGAPFDWRGTVYKHGEFVPDPLSPVSVEGLEHLIRPFYEQGAKLDGVQFNAIPEDSVLLSKSYFGNPPPPAR